MLHLAFALVVGGQARGPGKEPGGWEGLVTDLLRVLVL